MGILDDAIREHLELKRRHGAESDDLERLENEAFGALARPGDPDFAEPQGADADDADDAVATDSSEPAGGSTSDWLAAEEPTTVAPSVEPGGDTTAAERARAEHPHLEDTADHDGPEAGGDEPEPTDSPPMVEPLPPAGDAPSSEAPALADPEPDPPDPPERAIFDADSDELDFGDLDLDEEDDGTVNPQPASEPSSFLLEEDDLSLDLDDDEPPPFADPPTETAPRAPMVEEDTGNPPLPVPPRSADPESTPAGKDDEGEDLLEETPDFLRDTPDGDQAWFEQDPPKDFDFDDD